MTRRRFISEDAFHSEVSRLQKQRKLLLKEREQNNFMKDIDRSPFTATSPRETQEINNIYKNKEISGRSSRGLSIDCNPALQEVKMMLKDIMANNQKHGMDRTTSLRYLKNIQHRLSQELKSFQINNRRITPQVQKLRDLKLYVDWLVDSNQEQLKTVNSTIVKRINKSTKEGTKQNLERISEIQNPSITTSSNRLSQINEKTFPNQIPSIDQGTNNQTSRFNKQYQNKFKQNDNISINILDNLQNKLFQEIVSLRNQNNRLVKQLQQQRKRGTSLMRSNNPNFQDETIINQLANPIPMVQNQNVKLKNKVRFLQMQLLNWKSLRNITSKRQIRETQQKLYQQLQSKDDEIQSLKQQVQDLSYHLQNNKQYVKQLKRQITDLQNIENKKRSESHNPAFVNVRHIVQSERYVPSQFSNKFQQHLVSSRLIQNQDFVSNRKYFLSGNNNKGEYKHFYGKTVGRQKTQNTYRGQNQNHQDRLNQYRTLLNKLKDAKK